MKPEKCHLYFHSYGKLKHKVFLVQPAMMGLSLVLLLRHFLQKYFILILAGIVDEVTAKLLEWL